MIFPVRCAFFDVIIKMSKNEKYKDYIKNVGRFVGPYFYESDPVSFLKHRLTKAGFKDVQVEMREYWFQYPSFENLKSNKTEFLKFSLKLNLSSFTGAFQAINPFSPPKEIYEDFITECAQDVYENFCNRTLNLPLKALVSIVTK